MGTLTDESAPPEFVLNFTLTETVSVILIAVLGAFVLISEPAMLGAMLREHRLTAPQLGHTETAELLAMAAAVAIAGARLKPQRMRMIAVIAVLVISLGNFLTIFASGNLIVLARLLSGGGAGIGAWQLTCMVVRSRAPARIYGANNVVVNLVSLGLIQLTSRFFIPHFGASGSFGLMLGLSLLMILPALLIRDHMPALPPTSHHSGILTLRAIASLFAVIFFMGGFMAYWTYLVPLAAQLGYARSTVTLAISAAVVFQILGSISAAVTGKWAGYFLVLVPCFLVALLVLAALTVNLGTLAFIVAVAGISFILSFGIPFIAMPFLITADPSRRAAMYSFPAQLLGSALGPFLASLFASSQSVRGSLAVGFCLFALSLALVVGVHVRTVTKRETIDVLVRAKDFIR